MTPLTCIIGIIQLFSLETLKALSNINYSVCPSNHPTVPQTDIYQRRRNEEKSFSPTGAGDGPECNTTSTQMTRAERFLISQLLSASSELLPLQLHPLEVHSLSQAGRRKWIQLRI